MPRGSLKLTDARRLASLISPARLEIVECLQLHGPGTAAELAQRLGRAADGLYHHLRILERRGIVLRGGERASGGRRAVVYRLAADRLQADVDAGASTAFRRAWSDSAAAVLRAAEREVRRHVLSGQARSRGRRRDVHVSRAKARLSPSALAEVNAHLDAIRALVARHAREGGGDGTYFTLTCALAPTLEDDRGRS